MTTGTEQLFYPGKVTGEGRHPDRVPMRDRSEGLPLAALGAPMTTARQPIPVRAWISRPRHGVIQTDAQAVAWTPRAVRVEVEDEHGRTEQLWVWANAVERQTTSAAR